MGSVASAVGAPKAWLAQSVAAATAHNRDFFILGTAPDGIALTMHGWGERAH
jgi:hypothetical protein